MSDSKKQLYDLITSGWELGKYYFGKDYKTAAEYDDFTQFANDLLKKVAIQYGPTSKEYNFARRLYVAVNEYCDQTWRETHTGEQLSLFGRD